MENKELNNGVLMPRLALGTYTPEVVSYEEIKSVTKTAISLGYTAIDTAYFYRCEEGIGAALKEVFDSGLKKREDIFITTKIWMTFLRHDRVRLCVEDSLKKLGLAYADLVLIHFPIALKQIDDEIFPHNSTGELLFDDTIDYLDTWKGMEELVDAGLARAIGISNFNTKQIQRIVSNCRIKPAMHQLEIHPRLPNVKVVEYCHSLDIAVTAYSPLGKGTYYNHDSLPPLVEDENVKTIALKYNKTPSQILIAFALARNLFVAVKSYNEQRMKENLEALSIKLDPEDVKTLSTFKEKERLVALPGMSKAQHYPFHEE